MGVALSSNNLWLLSKVYMGLYNKNPSNLLKLLYIYIYINVSSKVYTHKRVIWYHYRVWHDTNCTFNYNYARTPTSTKFSTPNFQMKWIEYFEQHNSPLNIFTHYYYIWNVLSWIEKSTSSHLTLQNVKYILHNIIFTISIWQRKVAWYIIL